VVFDALARVVASTQSFKYQYKYQYLSLKYQSSDIIGLYGHLGGLDL